MTVCMVQPKSRSAMGERLRCSLVGRYWPVLLNVMVEGAFLWRDGLRDGIQIDKEKERWCCERKRNGDWDVVGSEKSWFEVAEQFVTWMLVVLNKFLSWMRVREGLLDVESIRKKRLCLWDGWNGGWKDVGDWDCQRQKSAGSHVYRETQQYVAGVFPSIYSLIS